MGDARQLVAEHTLKQGERLFVETDIENMMKIMAELCGMGEAEIAAALETYARDGEVTCGTGENQFTFKKFKR